MCLHTAHVCRATWRLTGPFPAQQKHLALPKVLVLHKDRVLLLLSHLTPHSGWPANPLLLKPITLNNLTLLFCFFLTSFCHCSEAHQCAINSVDSDNSYLVVGFFTPDTIFAVCHRPSRLLSTFPRLDSIIQMRPKTWRSKELVYILSQRHRVWFSTSLGWCVSERNISSPPSMGTFYLFTFSKLQGTIRSQTTCSRESVTIPEDRIWGSQDFPVERCFSEQPTKLSGVSEPVAPHMPRSSGVRSQNESS